MRCAGNTFTFMASREQQLGVTVCWDIKPLVNIWVCEQSEVVWLYIVISSQYIYLIYLVSKEKALLKIGLWVYIFQRSVFSLRWETTDQPRSREPKTPRAPLKFVARFINTCRWSVCHIRCPAASLHITRFEVFAKIKWNLARSWNANCQHKCLKKNDISSYRYM